MTRSSRASGARNTPEDVSSGLYLFSYGSNHPAQLAERLGHAVRDARGAYVEGWQRVFRGWSRRWESGVASLIKKPGAITYGYVTRISPDDLDVLDQYEGVASGNYKRQTLNATTVDGASVRAVVYVASSREFNAPSKAYLDAVTKTVGSFWSDVRPESFPLRDRRNQRTRRHARHDSDDKTRSRSASFGVWPTRSTKKRAR